MRTVEFADAVDDVLAEAAAGTTAVMCSESVWWRCHRRLIADFLTLARRTAVGHLGHDGRLTDHEPVVGARLSSDGVLIYDRHRDV